MYLLLEEIPSKTKIQIVPGWEIEVKQRFTIGIWQFVEDISNSVYKHVLFDMYYNKLINLGFK
jgi:hypothetical protein